MSEDDLRVSVNLDTTQWTQGMDSMKRGMQNWERDLARSGNQIRRSLSDAASVFNRLDIAQVALSKTVERHAKAQDTFNEAVSQFGANSGQAAAAAEEMRKAHAALEEQQRRNALSMGLVAAQSIQMATRIPAAVSALRALSAAQWSAATAGAALANVVTLGAAAAGIITGWLAIKGAMDGFSDSALRATTHAEFLTLALHEQRKLAIDDAHTKLGDVADKLRLQDEEKRALQENDQAWFQERLAVLDSNLKAEQAKIDGSQAAEIAKWIAYRDERLAAVKAAEEQMRTIKHENSPAFKAAKAMAEQAARDATATQEWLAANSLATEAQAAAIANNIIALQSEHGRLTDAASNAATNSSETAMREMEAQARAMQDSLSQGLNAFGMSMQNLSVSALQSLSTLDGPLGALSASLAAVKANEESLTKAALQSSEALRDQASITKSKDETTESFIERLKELGYTESDIAARISETGDALLSQADATRAAMQATQQLAGASGGGGASSRTASAGGWKVASMERIPTLQEFLEQNNLAVRTAFRGRTPHPADAGMDAAGVARILQSGGSGVGIPYVGAWTGDANSDTRERMVNALKQMIMQKLPSNQWDAMLGGLGVNGYAHGVEGIIRRPGLFYAGEHGAESISIKPLPLRDMGRGSGVNVTFAPGSIVVRGGGEAVADEVLRALARRVKGLGVLGD